MTPDGLRATADRVIECLRSVHARQRMYIDTADVANPPKSLRTADVRAVENFLLGLRVGCAACGFDLPNEAWEQGTLSRGTPYTPAGPVAEMRERGLTEENIVDELFAIEIASWEAWRDGLA